MSEALRREVLFNAIRDNDADTAREILKSGIDPEQTFGEHQVRLVHVAADRGAMDSLRLLLEIGANINAVAPGRGFDKSALHYAAIAGQTEAVDFLLSHGCDAVHKTINGALPVHMAAEHGQLEAVKKLVEHMDARDLLNQKDRRSILQMAIIHDRAEVVEYWMKRWPPSDINAQDDQGMALLHWAAHNGAGNVARLFIKHGADDTQICGDGRTMMDFAKCTPVEVVLAECQSLRNSRKLARAYRRMRRSGP